MTALLDAQTVATVKFLPPTNTRGSRYVASVSGASGELPFRATVEMDYASGHQASMERAVRLAMAKRFAWLAGVAGAAYTIEEVEFVQGPDRDLRYAIVTYSVS